MPAIRNVILDWSGTLVDDLNPVREATNEIFKLHGKAPFELEEFREKFFLPFPEFYQAHLPELQLPELDHHYHTAFKMLQTGIEILPHAQKFLDYLLERGMPTFLLSSIHHEHFEAQGARLNLKKYFKQAYVQALDKRKVILHLLTEHDLDPSETIFIGDMIHDVETARHAGVMSCAVLTGYNSLGQLKTANPDLLFRNLGEVQAYLERHRDAALKPPVVTVGALIFNPEGKVLMIQSHKWSHCWGIPGGKIKPSEKALDAVRREVREETGLEITEIRFEMVQDCIDPSEFYMKAHFVLLAYSALTAGMEVTLNDEGEAYRWVSPTEMADLNLNGPTQTLLNYVRSHPNY